MLSRNIALKVSSNGTQASYTDGQGDRLAVEIYSNGQTVISVNEGAAVLLGNRAAHELRDFLNARFPNATEVQ